MSLNCGPSTLASWRSFFEESLELLSRASRVGEHDARRQLVIAFLNQRPSELHLNTQLHDVFRRNIVINNRTDLITLHETEQESPH